MLAKVIRIYHKSDAHLAMQIRLFPVLYVPI